MWSFSGLVFWRGLMLNDEELHSYQQDGQINSPVSISSEMLETIKEKMGLFFINNPELDQDYAPDLFKYDRSWLDIAKAPEILDIVAQIIGDDIICWGSAFFAKRGLGGKATPWHQDGQYWPIEPLETCTVWIAVDHATEENGCLRVIPGSHKNREHFAHFRDDSDEIVLNQALDLDSLPFGNPRSVILKPGMFSIHDAFMIHGAEANNSGQQRAGLTFRYMPGTSHFNRLKAKEMVNELGVIDISERDIFLMRGFDRSRLNDISEI